jgi:PD-(D/E)XK nuclease superfamily
MTLPHPPKPTKLACLSLSTYEAMRYCKARAAWLAFGNREVLPGSPAAILGLCFHDVVAKAQTGQLYIGGETVESAARHHFNNKAEDLFTKSHEMFKVKFGVKERLPFYYLRREESVALARTLSPGASHPVGSRSSKQKPSPKDIEQSLRSKDDLLYGRPDLIDSVAGEVVDYKTRRESSEDSEEITDRERRQLRFYAHLANENGMKVQRGTIALANGKRFTVELSDKEVLQEAISAVEALESYNATVNSKTTFEEIATPAPQNCLYCPCMVLCEAFWGQAKPAWQESVGAHLQGKIQSISNAVVQGTNLVTLHIQSVGGTICESGEVVLEQIPEEWLLGRLKPSNTSENLVRIINARIGAITPERTVLRADRTATEVWLFEN